MTFPGVDVKDFQARFDREKGRTSELSLNYEVRFSVNLVAAPPFLTILSTAPFPRVRRSRRAAYGPYGRPFFL